MYKNFESLKVEVHEYVARVTIDRPPINLQDMVMLQDLLRLGEIIKDDDQVKVIIFKSADPLFFMAHADVEGVQGVQEMGLDTSQPNIWHDVTELYRTMPKISIAQIEGQAMGGGCEFLMGVDLRYAAIDRARFGLPEVALGFIPGGGGSARLPELVGRSRALEIILGCTEFDAIQAERYGYINQALPAHKIAAFVSSLASRIATFPSPAIATAKQFINDAGGYDFAGRLKSEYHTFADLLHNEDAESEHRMKKALAMGMQTRDVEVAGIDDLLVHLAPK